MEDNREKGYVLLPYITKTVKTSINGEAVWYVNKWKNLQLRSKKPTHRFSVGGM